MKKNLFIVALSIFMPLLVASPAFAYTSNQINEGDGIGVRWTVSGIQNTDFSPNFPIDGCPVDAQSDNGASMVYFTYMVGTDGPFQGNFDFPQSPQSPPLDFPFSTQAELDNGNPTAFNITSIVMVCSNNDQTTQDTYTLTFPANSEVVNTPGDPAPTAATAPSLDPVVGSSISAATGSITQTAASFVISSFLHALQYILLVVGLFVSYRLIKKWMKGEKGDNDDGFGNTPTSQADWTDDNRSYPSDVDDSWMSSAGGIEQHITDQGGEPFYGAKREKE